MRQLEGKSELLTVADSGKKTVLHRCNPEVANSQHPVDTVRFLGRAVAQVDHASRLLVIRTRRTDDKPRCLGERNKC